MTEATFAQKIQKFELAYTQFISLAEKYPETLQTQAGVCGDWSAREVLAHINGWFVEAQRRYPRYAKGTGHMDYNIDTFNKISVWLRKDKDFEQILAELRQLSSKMATMAHEIPSQYLERDTRYGEWLVGFTEEAEEHSKQLQEFLETNQ